MSLASASAARAFVVTTLVALAADALLGALTELVGAVAGGPSPPWWVAGHVVERSRWVMFALLLAGSARAVGPESRDLVVPGPAAWRLVGRLALVVPLLWLVALWIVQAILFTVAGRWDIDGQVYLSADYYRRVFAGYVPWLLGGAAALVGSRHVR